MLSVIFALLLITPLDSTAFKYIHEAFKLLNIEEYELGFKKARTERDAFRLTIVDSLMRTPLSLPSYLGESVDRVKGRSDTLSMLVRFMLDQLDIKAGRAFGYRIRDRLPVNLEKTIVELIERMLDETDKHLKTALRNLTRGEIDTLLYVAVSLWSDEDDSTDDTLRGILLKEAGITLDSLYDVELDTLLRILKKIDKNELGRAIYTFSVGIDELTSILSKYGDFLTPGIYETRYGPLLIGTGEDEYYEADSFPFIIDPGGNDKYKGRAGGGIGFMESFYPYSFVIDLKGDDVYKSEKAISMGSGFLSCGALIDFEGNDIYEGSHISEGAGLFGCGILVDLKGSDVYHAGFFSQGAANFGIGILIERDGDDNYRAVDWAQGFGSVSGYGLLYDREGDDSYYAGGHYIHHPLLPDQYRSFAQGFAMGWRRPASGGIGFLLDEEGNDSYYVEVYGQGASYWYSLGMLADLEGNDTYTAAEYAQGAGIHLSLGILYDGEGDDHHFSRFGPSLGEGHDFAVGVLIDRSGDDSYVVSGGLGIGLTNSFGLFIDYSGNDIYSITEKLGIGDANWTRDMGGIGIFIDLGGEDFYPGHKPAKNRRYWVQGTFGCGIDLEESK